MIQSDFRTWMLPEGVVESLPHDAEKLNTLEQIAITLFSRWGYQYVRPPLLEYVDTFLTGDNTNNLAQQTIQIKDQKSSKQLGFRSDFTPQIARMDAHYLKTSGVARYAYAGEVIRNYPAGHGSARNPAIVGAELLGSASHQADIEIVSLLIHYLDALQLPHYLIELGNVDIVVELLDSFHINHSYYPLFFDALAKKDKEKLKKLALQCQLDSSSIFQLKQLTRLYGGAEVILEGMDYFAQHEKVLEEINRLKKTVDTLKKQHPSIDFHIDFADVHGYGYHNGLIFSAYTPGVWQAIARGGRYDSFGNHFDKQAMLRPSTGFSCHLNLLAGQFTLPQKKTHVIACTFDPTDNPILAQTINTLRQQGHSVITLFDDNPSINRTISHHLVKQGDDFVLEQI